jgi:hypothetical protein
MLERIEDDFDTAREMGYKMAPQFTYGWVEDQQSDAAEDADADRILAHLNQLTPILEENTDVMSVMYAGFIGPWGEWHSSTAGNLDENDQVNDATRAIYDGLMEAVPEEDFVALRYPVDLRGLIDETPVTEEEAFGSSDEARTGLHDDGFLQNVYADEAQTEEGQAYRQELGQYTPSIENLDLNLRDPDGEKLEGDEVLEELESRGSDYVTDTFSWDPAVENGDETFETAALEVGYRFRLEEAELSGEVAAGEMLGYEFVIANDGYSAPYTERPVEIVLVAEDGAEVALPLDADPRLWKGGETQVVSGSVALPEDLPAGTYEAHLAFPDAHESLADDPRYAIQLANEAVWEPETGMNDFGLEVSVEAAQGAGGGAEQDDAATAQGTVVLDDENFITVDGKRFFPYGYYIEDTDPETVSKDIRILSEAGFNLIFVEPVDNDPMEEVFDTAEAEYVKVIYSPSKYVGPDGLEQVIADVSQEPSLLGYAVGDDVRDGEMTGRPRDVEEVGAFDEAIKAQDPDHLTFASIGGGTTETIYDERRWDISGPQIYPVNGGSRIDLTFEAVRESVLESEANGQATIATLQAFDPDDNPSQRLPTSEEYVNMTYQALVAGAQGVIYYSYDNFGNGIESDPELFKTAGEVAEQIEVLEPYLTSGSYDLVLIDESLYVATWEEGDTLVAAVVYAGDYQTFEDPSDNDFDTRSFSFELPDGYEASVVGNPFDDETFDLSNEGGTVEGEIDLLDVQVAQFTKADPSPFPSSEVIGASGTVIVEQPDAGAWTRVEFGTEIEDAVVVLGPPSSNGGEPTSVRVRDVDETGFEMQLDEWAYLDGAHKIEQVSWMAVEAGTHLLEDGRTIQAGTAVGGAGWTEVALDDAFGEEDGDGDPAVFATVASPDGADALAPRLRQVQDDQFEFRLDAEEVAPKDAAEGAALNWIAVEEGPAEVAGGLAIGDVGALDHRGAEVAYGTAYEEDPVLLAAMQTTNGGDTATLRVDGRDADGARLRVEEERSRDDETRHKPEDVAYLTTQAGTIEGWADII